MKTRLLLSLAGALLLAALPVSASPIVFNFGGPDGAITAPATFTAGGLSITATGIVGNTSVNLYQKSDSASETGLGLDGTVDHEINPEEAVIFDFTNLIKAGYTSGTFTLGSLQSGEQGEA
ncbi:MAG: hypothetical protein ACRD2D_07935, partial [Terriglobales bacterium]